VAVVFSDGVTPAGGAELRGALGRIDDVGEDDRGENSFVACLPILAVRPHRLEVDRNPGLVADHPGIMPWRDLEHVSRADLELRAVGHLYSEAPGQRDPDVVVLTGLCACDGFDVHRPAPPGL